MSKKTLLITLFLLFSFSFEVMALGVVVDPAQGGYIWITNTSNVSQTFYFRVFPMFQLADGRVTKAENSPLPLLLVEPEDSLVILRPKEKKKVQVSLAPTVNGVSGAIVEFESVLGTKGSLPILALAPDGHVSAEIIQSGIYQEIPNGPVFLKTWIRNTGDFPLYLRLASGTRVGPTSPVLPKMVREVSVFLGAVQQVPEEVSFTVLGVSGNLSGKAKRVDSGLFATKKEDGLWVEGANSGIISFSGKEKEFIVPPEENEIIFQKIPAPWWVEITADGAFTQVFSFSVEPEDFFPSPPVSYSIKEGEIDIGKWEVYKGEKYLGTGKVNLVPGSYLLKNKFYNKELVFPFEVFPAISTQVVFNTEVKTHFFYKDIWIGELENEVPKIGDGYISVGRRPYFKTTFPYQGGESAEKVEDNALWPLVLNGEVLIATEDLFGVTIEVEGYEPLYISYWPKGFAFEYLEGMKMVGRTAKTSFSVMPPPDFWEKVK